MSGGNAMARKAAGSAGNGDGPEFLPEPEPESETDRLGPERDLSEPRPRERWIVAIAFVLMIAGLFAGDALVAFDPGLGANGWNYLLFGLGGAFLGLVVMVLMLTVLRSERRSELASKQLQAIRAETQALKTKTDEDFFSSLVAINFKYIDQYYLQTRTQADKSFVAAVAAAAIGFGVMIAGIVMMYGGQAEPGYVTTAAGLISQFIAAIFFYLYNRTVIAMAGYHRKLVLTQNVGLALRITQDLPADRKAEARLQLIDRLSTDINTLLASDGSED